MGWYCSTKKGKNLPHCRRVDLYSFYTIYRLNRYAQMCAKMIAVTEKTKGTN